jgi:CRP-like cAMP-binding protein
MPKIKPPSPAPANQILARLPTKDYQRLLPHWEPVALALKKVLYAPRSLTEYAYFPTRGVISMVTLMEDGRAIEVATVGNEGMVGLAIILGADRAPAQFIVQVPGEALRMRAMPLREEAGSDTALRGVILLYHDAFLKQMSQSARRGPALLSLDTHDARPRQRQRVYPHPRVPGTDARRAALHGHGSAEPTSSARAYSLPPGQGRCAESEGTGAGVLRVLPRGSG